MSCSCRATQLRNFVQGLVQVRKFEATSLRGLVRLAPTAPRAPAHGRLLDTRRQQRNFHVSVRQRGEAACVDAVVSTETARDALIAASEHGGPSSSPETEKPFWDQDDTEEPQRTPRSPEQQTTKPDSKRVENGSKRSKPKRVRETCNVGEKPNQDSGKDKPKRVRKTCNDGEKRNRDSREKGEGKHKLERWQIQKAALKEKFPEGWNPRKRLSPDALTGIRALNAQFPDVYTTEALANKFKVSAEGIRRILRSHWQPSPEQEEERRQRWFRRGMQVWERKAAIGIKPPKRWRMEGIVREPEYHERSRYASQREREWDEQETSKYRERRAAAAQDGWRTGERP